MSSSSSSSSSCDGGSKKKKHKEKDKKGKKSKKNKKQKKSKKDDKNDKKQKKRVQRADEWQCDRGEAIRLIKQLLEQDADVASELEAVFSALDDGEVVHIDGLENARVKKKLRHLLKALRLAPEGQGFKTADIKVSFAALFSSCHKEASKREAATKRDHSTPDMRKGPSLPIDVQTPFFSEPMVPVEEEQIGAIASIESSEAPIAPPAKRKKGPQLPMPGVGPGNESVGGSDDDEVDVDECGPRLAGSERQGVDLDRIGNRSAREDWMTKPHESIAAAFGEGVAKVDKYEVGRSKEEREAFEKMFAERGKSLLERQAEGEFAGNEEEQKRVRGQKIGPSENWGMSTKEQERGSAAAGQGGVTSTVGRRAFDPEQDLQVRKPMSGTDFAKLVENSGSALAGRFSRSAVATSFL